MSYFSCSGAERRATPCIHENHVGAPEKNNTGEKLESYIDCFVG